MLHTARVLPFFSAKGISVPVLSPCLMRLIHITDVFLRNKKQLFWLLYPVHIKSISQHLKKFIGKSVETWNHLTHRHYSTTKSLFSQDNKQRGIAQVQSSIAALLVVVWQNLHTLFISQEKAGMRVERSNSSWARILGDPRKLLRLL